ncbi:MAG TPA: hypothetical protein VGM70_07740 [Pseudolysinimonas sp.]
MDAPLGEAVISRAEGRATIAGMSLLLDAIERHQGLASRHEVLMSRILPAWFDLSVRYGRGVIRVRKGWYARSDERPDVLRAWRVGGRLTCVSAAAFHAGVPAGPVLHVEVPAGAVRLRDPDHADRRLQPDAAVVVHWTRHPGPGDRRAVGVEHAEAVAALCGVHAAGVRRHVSSR